MHLKIQNLVQPSQGQIQTLHIDEIELALNETGANLSLENMDSCYFVISGYGTLKVDEYLYSLSPQSSVYIPAGNDHWFNNSGNVGLRLVRYYTKA